MLLIVSPVQKISKILPTSGWAAKPPSMVRKLVNADAVATRVLGLFSLLITKHKTSALEKSPKKNSKICSMIIFIWGR